MIYVILYYGMGWLLLPCHGVNDKNDKYETSVFLWINQMSPLPLCIEWDFIQNRWFHKFHIRSGLFLYFLASAADLCVEVLQKIQWTLFQNTSSSIQFPSQGSTRIIYAVWFNRARQYFYMLRNTAQFHTIQCNLAKLTGVLWIPFLCRIAGFINFTSDQYFDKIQRFRTTEIQKLQ